MLLNHNPQAYLIPALDRPNLKVLTNAHVNKILIDATGEHAIASGVEFEHGGSIHTVHCKKEVILSAGYVISEMSRTSVVLKGSLSTVKSPQILELSGIGDRKILEPLGLDVKVDLL